MANIIKPNHAQSMSQQGVNTVVMELLWNLHIGMVACQYVQFDNFKLFVLLNYYYYPVRSCEYLTNHIIPI